ncbi:MAG TPA: DUF1573 domain-containing protein [Phycisphaerales bacterium]
MAHLRTTTFCVLAAGAACSAAAFAQQAASPAGDPLPPRPGQVAPEAPKPVGPSGRFTPVAKTFDFGKILCDKPVEHVFKFKNTGDANLIITSATGSCHCTVPALAKSEYAPGEEGEIKVVFDPKGKAAGKVQQRVTVVSNDPTSPTSSLTIEADLMAIVTVEPARLVAFGQIAKGESKTVELNLTGRLENFNITGVTFDGVGEEIKPVIGSPEPVEINGEKMKRVNVKLVYPAAKKIERFQRNVIITTNDEREKEIRLPVMGEVLGDLDVRPMRVSMGLVAREAEFSNTATITSRGGKPFKIKGIKQIATPGREDPQLTFDIKPNTKAGGGEPSEYTVAVSGKAPKESFRSVIDCEVLTDMPGEESIKLGVYIVVR